MYLINTSIWISACDLVHAIQVNDSAEWIGLDFFRRWFQMCLVVYFPVMDMRNREKVGFGDRDKEGLSKSATCRGRKERLAMPPGNCSSFATVRLSTQLGIRSRNPLRFNNGTFSQVYNSVQRIRSLQSVVASMRAVRWNGSVTKR